jgi:hypothetical protein
MDKRSKVKVDKFISDAVAPKRLKGSESIALQDGRRRIRLVDDEGRATQAGLYWSVRTGEDLPLGGFMHQVASRIGNSETIRLRDGTRGEVRRFNEATGEYKFTRLGHTYYMTIRRNYLATVPVLITGRRKDNSTYTTKSTMPVSKLGLTPTTLPSNMTESQRRTKVKALVLRELPAVLYEFSDEVWTLDPDGPWKIHEESVGMNEELTPVARTVMDRRTGALPTFSQFLFHDALCPEAFEDVPDKLCCPRQIAAVLRLDFGSVCNDLAVIERQL